MNLTKYEIQLMSQFLRENKKLLEEGNLKALYEALYEFFDSANLVPEHTYLLTYILLSSGINPLEHMDTVPGNYISDLLDIQEITIPKNVEHIKANAFSDCTSLKKVTFSEGLIKIDWGAFRDTSIKEVYLPDSIQLVDEDAFYFNKYLIKVSVPKTLKNIYPATFRDCPNLTEITFRGTVNDLLGDSALYAIYSGICYGTKIEKITCSDGELRWDPGSESLFEVI